MPGRIVPMIHVPDVRVTVDWYASIGFRVVDVGKEDGREDGEAVWALLALGDGRVMLSIGRPSSAERREIDLYIYTEDGEGVARRIRDRVRVVEDLHDTFYGTREFIIRDCNGFWITFGQPIRR